MLTRLTKNLAFISRIFSQNFGILFLSLILSNFHQISAQEEQQETFDQNIVNSGESLFKGNCTVCHAINEVVIGPALRDVHERQSEEWIYAFIKNSQKVIKSGDEYAVDLYNQYNQTLMTSFDFSDDELNSILTYIKSESAKEIQVAVVDNVVDGGEVSSSSISSDNFYLSLGLNIVLLLVLIFILLRFTNLSKKYVILKDNQNKGKLLDDDDKEIVDSGFKIKEFIKSNKVVGIASFVFIAVFVKSCIDGLYTIGIQQNYQPTQPIACLLYTSPSPRDIR